MALKAFSRRGWSCVYCTTHSFRLLFRLLYGDVRIRVNREVWGNGERHYLAAMPGTSAHGIGPAVEHAIGQLVNDWGRRHPSKFRGGDACSSAAVFRVLIRAPVRARPHESAAREPLS
jgi:hypothetical protein